MLSGLLLLAAFAAPPPDTTHLVLVATTDVHGRAYGWDYVTDRPFGGGLARVATVVDSLRARYPGRVLMFDAGDLIQGDPFAAVAAADTTPGGNAVIRAMNLVGYDAATIGNHEFNWGLETLHRALGAARYPVVSGNIVALPGDTLLYRPYVVLERAGVRVGVSGFTTPGVMVWDRENVRGRVRVDPIEPRAGDVLRAVRRSADLSIVLIHSGMEGETSYDTTGIGPEDVAARLARLPDKPDLVVVGHSHREMRDSVLNGVHFIQPRNWAQGVAVMHVTLVRGDSGWRLVSWEGESVPLADVRPDPRITTALAGAHDSTRAWATRPLAVAPVAMPAVGGRAGPTPMVGFIHAAQKRRTGATLSVASTFNLAGGFPAGQVRRADVASIYPYENSLRAIRISGAALRALLERSAEYYQVDESGGISINPDMPGYNFDMISGATYEMDLSRPAGRRIRRLAVGGRAVKATDSFTLAINSYRQGGGGGYDMLRDAPVIYDKGENIADLLADELERLGTVVAADFAEDNWRIIPESAARQVRALAPRATDAP
jgi:2',3'-cyclic-nucleotide 2'-phosphodiesterase/3'-nucleotidase